MRRKKLSHAIVFMANTCVRHIDFLKVGMQATVPHSQAQHCTMHIHKGAWFLPSRQTTQPMQYSDYELFNRNNF